MDPEGHSYHFFSLLRDDVERSVSETLVKVGKLGRIASNEGGINLSAVANVTESDTTTTTNEDKPNGNGHRLSISVGSTLGLIFMIISNTNS